MRRFLLSFLRLSSFLMLSALLAGGEAAALTFGALALLFPVGLMALGILQRGRLGRAGVALLVLAGLLQGSFWVLVSLEGQVEAGPWLLGLPAAVVVLLVGLWILPLVLVSLAHGLTFGDQGLAERDLERLRRAARKAASGGEGGG